MVCTSAKPRIMGNGLNGMGNTPGALQQGRTVARTGTAVCTADCTAAATAAGSELLSAGCGFQPKPKRLARRVTARVTSALKHPPRNGNARITVVMYMVVALLGATAPLNVEAWWLLPCTGSAVSAMLSGRTVATEATLGANQRCISALIEAGSDTDKPNKYGNTPLYYAAGRGDMSMIATLLEAGADVNKGNKVGDSPLHAAIGSATRWMLTGDLDMEAMFRATNLLNKFGGPALQMAVTDSKVRVVVALLEAGADVDKVDEHGITPLHDAAASGEVHVVNTLIAVGAAVDPVDDHGSTPLHWAAGSKAGADAVVALIEAGANVDNVDEGGNTPLHLTARSGSSDVVLALIKAGAAVDKANYDGDTPFTVALNEGNFAVARAFKLFKATGNAKLDKAYQLRVDGGVDAFRFQDLSMYDLGT